jgi:hypothetical protein
VVDVNDVKQLDPRIRASSGGEARPARSECRRRVIGQVDHPGEDLCGPVSRPRGRRAIHRRLSVVVSAVAALSSLVAPLTFPQSRLTSVVYVIHPRRVNSAFAGGDLDHM